MNPYRRNISALVSVASIGTTRHNVLARLDTGRCEPRVVEMPEYPPCPEGERLSSVRRSLDLSLRQAAARVRITPMELNDLEHGRLRPKDPDDWARLEADMMAREHDE